MGAKSPTKAGTPIYSAFPFLAVHPVLSLDLLYPAAVVLMAYLALGITGFASALVCVPLLAWHWPLGEVVPLVLMTDFSASILMGGLNLREVCWRDLRQLVPGVVVGALIGLWLSARVHSTLPLLVLGLYVAGVGARALLARPAAVAPRAPDWQGPIFGLLVGAVEFLFATCGPLILAWFARRQMSARGMRASVPAFAVLLIPGVLAMIALDGRLSTSTIWHRYLALVPLALIGVAIGHVLARRLPVAALRAAICALLVLSGLVLAVNALRGLI